MRKRDADRREVWYEQELLRRMSLEVAVAVDFRP